MKISATKPKPKPKLNRFTSLPIALDMLSRREITLLTPDTWEDRNDAYYLERYRDERKLRSVLAVCFSMKSETFHHWRIFSSGASGVCIEFDKARLISSFSGVDGISMRNVSYKWVKEVSGAHKPKIEEWPFLKRKPFEAESEFRIIYETKTDLLRAKSFAFDLVAIRHITLSPWIPDSVAQSVKKIFCSIPGCDKIPVNRSTLLDNSGWRNAIEN